MTTTKSFILSLRMLFVLSSLYFMQDAFYFWDGYSFYMRFRDFLPELSLAFILWTVPAIFLIVIFWMIIYGLSKMLPGLFRYIRFEHILVALTFLVVVRAFKKIFLKDFYLSDALALSNYTAVIIKGVLAAGFVYLVRKYTDKIVHELNARIIPLIYLFVFLLILALPFSLLKKGHSGSGHLNSNLNKQVISSAVKPPNIIVVTMDTLTALDMQVYGYERTTTPFISEWARDAVVFNRVYASSNWTTPTTTSLMTGQNVWTHRIWYRALNNPVNSYKDNLPSVLKDYGYDVYGYIQNSFADLETLGIKDAFLVKDKYYTFHRASGWWFERFKKYFIDKPIVTDWIFSSSYYAFYIDLFAPHRFFTTRPSELVYNRFLNNMSHRNNPQKPFFAWLHVNPPHDFYLPPEPYMGVFGDAEKFNTDKKQSRLLHIEYKPDRQKEINILRKRYDEFILYSDQRFKAFLTDLAGLVDMSNTIVILSADHGESFSHGYQSHDGPYLYEPFVHIPLIIKAPGRIKSRKIDLPVSQIDIAPTILEFAGIKAQAWMEGGSLLPLIDDKPFESKPVFSMQLIQNRSFGHPINKGTIAVWDGDYKLIYYLKDRKILLFNLHEDPDETQNLFEKEPQEAQRLKKLINDNLVRANKRITQIKESS